MTKSEPYVAPKINESIDSLDSFFCNPKVVGQLVIDHMILMAGFLSATGFVAFVNKRIGKQGQHKIDRGQSLAALLIILYNGSYRSLNASESHIIGTALPALLRIDPEIKPEYFNRDVFADALESIYSYGSDKLFSEYAVHVKSLNLTKLNFSDSVHIDTSSMMKIGLATTNQEQKEAEIKLLNEAEFQALMMKDLNFYDESLDSVIEFKHWTFTDTFEPIKDGGKRPVDFAYGHSKDHRADKPQVIIGSAADENTGLPIYFRLWDGNRSDKLNFSDMITEIFDAIATSFKKLKYFTGDSALCTSRSFEAAKERGLHIITRVPDNLNIARNEYTSDLELTEVCSQEEWDDLHSKKSIVPKHRMIYGLTLFDRPVVGCLYLNENLAKTKTKSVMNKANKELNKVNKQLSKNAFYCEKDAKAAYEALTKDLKYCSLSEFTFSCVEKKKTRGRPKKDGTSETCIDHIQITSACSLDEDKINKAIRQECMYLLVTTDTDRDWTGLQLLEKYKNNMQVENIWKELKNRKLYLSRFFLQKTERVEGLLWLVMVAVFARKFMQQMITNHIAEEKITLTKDFPGHNVVSPKMDNIDFYFKGLQVLFYKNGEVNLNHVNPVALAILKAMGKPWWELLFPVCYRPYSEWPMRGVL